MVSDLELENALRHWYPQLGRPLHLEERPARGRLRIWEVTAPLGRFLVRLHPSMEEAKGLPFEVHTLRFLREQRAWAPEVLLSADERSYGEVAGRPFVVFAEATGTAATREDAETLGRVLAEIHRLGLEFDPPPRAGMPPWSFVDWFDPETWDWQAIEMNAGRLADEAPELAAALPYLRELPREVASWLRTTPLSGPVPAFGLVHGSFGPEAVFVAGSEVCAVRNWERSRADWLVADLALGLWQTAGRQGASVLDQEVAHRFLQGYRSAGGPVGEEELSLLAGVLRVELLGLLLRRLAEGAEASEARRLLLAVEAIRPDTPLVEP